MKELFNQILELTKENNIETEFHVLPNNIVILFINFHNVKIQLNELINTLIFTDKNGSIRKFCFDDVMPVRGLIDQLNRTGTITRKFMIKEKVSYVKF